MSTDETFRVATRGEVRHLTRGERDAAVEDWMSTFVSVYDLPKRINRARKNGAVKTAIPLESLDRLIARVELARSKGQKSLGVGLETVAGFLEEVGVAA